MQIEATKKLFTVEEYYRMADAGILAPEDRVELIDGEVIQMSPIGSRHFAAVTRSVDLFTATFRGKAVVSAQQPLRLNNHNEPEPDIVLLRWRDDYYASGIPNAQDALLVVEVSDTTLRYDRDVKLPLYAAAGIPEVWIADLRENALLVYCHPAANTYATRLILQRDDSVSPSAFPETVFKIANLLG